MTLGALAFVLGAGLSCATQELPAIGDLNAPRAAQGMDRVRYVSEPQVLPVGKSAVLRLRFAVDDGFHINSHRPKGDLLIATELRVEPATGARVGAAVYPAGQAYNFAGRPDEVLDIYTGGFAVELPMTATAGEHTVKATLRYQACDRAMCYPVRSLPVTAEFTAK